MTEHFSDTSFCLTVFKGRSIFQVMLLLFMASSILEVQLEPESPLFSSASLAPILNLKSSSSGLPSLPTPDLIGELSQMLNPSAVAFKLFSSDFLDSKENSISDCSYPIGVPLPRSMGCREPRIDGFLCSKAVSYHSNVVLLSVASSSRGM